MVDFILYIHHSILKTEKKDYMSQVMYMSKSFKKPINYFMNWKVFKKSQ